MEHVFFTELKVYQLSEMLSDKIWEMVIKWNHFHRSTLGNQLVRAADRIGANIAEGYGKGSFADNKRFIKIARGSLYETRHFLRRSFIRGLMTQKQVNEIEIIIRKLSPSLNAYLKSIGTAKSNPKSPTNDQ